MFAAATAENFSRQFQGRPAPQEAAAAYAFVQEARGRSPPQLGVAAVEALKEKIIVLKRKLRSPEGGGPEGHSPLC